MVMASPGIWMEMFCDGAHNAYALGCYVHAHITAYQSSHSSTDKTPGLSRRRKCRELFFWDTVNTQYSYSNISQ